MAGHTKGPWRVTSLHFVRTADGRAVAGVYGNREDCREDQCMRDRARLIAAAPDLLAALASVNKLISEAAMTGFNCHDGDWAERLFYSQQATSAALHLAKHGAPAKHDPNAFNPQREYPGSYGAATTGERA